MSQGSGGGWVDVGVREFVEGWGGRRSRGVQGHRERAKGVDGVE